MEEFKRKPDLNLEVSVERLDGFLTCRDWGSVFFVGFSDLVFTYDQDYQQRVLLAQLHDKKRRLQQLVWQDLCIPRIAILIQHNPTTSFCTSLRSTLASVQLHLRQQQEERERQRRKLEREAT